MIALNSLSVFLIFCQFLMNFYSTQAQNQSQNSSCLNKFKCGSLGDVSFPFSVSPQPACGLYTIDCDVTPNPIIRLDGNVYSVMEKLPYDRFQVIDRRLQGLLAENSCQSFDRGISFPSSPSTALRIIEPNVTLFKCNNSLDTDRRMNNDYFHDYLNCTRSSSFSIYYKIPSREQEGYLDVPEGDLPGNCSPIRLPIPWRSRRLNTQNGSLFDLLTANFTIQWSLSEDCTLPAVIGLSTFSICLGVVKWRFKKGKGGKGGRSHSFTRNKYSDRSRKDHEGDSKYFGVPVFSYSTLEEATNNFDSSQELGDGGFGTVYYGKLRDGREVAVKRLYEQSSKRMVQFKNEIEILTHLRHQNLVMLYGCTSRHSRELLLVYEYIPNGTVADHLHGEKAKNGTLIWTIRMKIAIETASALAYRHASDIIHRDVKTCNILLDNNFCVKVADFGLSRLFPNDVTHISTAPPGMPGYVDPDYHSCYQLTSKSDLIDPSLGYESNAEVRKMTISVAELAFQCLQLEKEMRPTIDEVLEVLKAIQKGEFENQKDEEIDIIVEVPPAPESENDDAQLLKTKLPVSPNSVNDKWFSCSITASISG
ncbi:putative serine/threonine-protein kinase [Capsicum baccatum]|uniref:Serine/threonine-protein kinase n=1 Tax=Capsicum baccatum TaxID=33114 RepID=A0A2G2WSL6_CAPBA|nr:putative serine/threonine-protein kinase [Capsicum baccatum]